MIAKLGTAALIFLLTLCSANKNSYHVNFTGNDPFATEWKEIDALDKQRLPKQALAKVLVLLDKAKKKGDADQVIKAFLYRAKYTQELNEEGAALAIAELEAELKTAEGVTKALLQSTLAETYVMFYNSQQWVINQRTEMAVESEDMLTWTAKQFLGKAKGLYLASLEDLEALRQPISEIEFILQNGFNADKVQPTIYDFLAQRAIDFFNNYNNLITEPVSAYVLSAAEIFGLPAEFLSHDFELGEKTTGVAQAIELYKELTRFHIDDVDKSALIDISRKRIEFGRQHATLENIKEEVSAALLKLVEAYPENPESAEVLLQLASLHKNVGDQENSQKEKRNPGSYNLALKYIAQIKSQFPDSWAVKQAEFLKSQILQPTLRLQLESFIPSEKEALALVDFKNLNKIYWKLARVERDVTRESFQRTRVGEVPKKLNQLDPLKTWTDNVDLKIDHFSHALETNFDGLPYGEYVLIVSNEEKLNSASTFQYAFFQVTDLTLVQVNQQGLPSKFLIAHRETGAPLSGVQMELYNRKRLQTTKTSDSNGMIDLEWPKREYLGVKLKKGNDYFNPFANVSVSRQYSSGSKYEMVHFFLDRKIYRPTQKIYFKGIAISSDNESKPSILTNKKVTVRFVNPNGENVGTEEFTTNEFGSFAGSFIAPSAGLLGGFSIIADIGGSTNFNIEEYKRPKFEVTVDRPEGKTSLNEMIKVKGSAKALAGYAIDGAEVKYRITRAARFPWCPYWRIPWYYNRSEAEIANGTATTNDLGVFEFEFLAKPDGTIKASDRPEFVYSIQVDVVDGNGETRSAASSVRAGYVNFTVNHNLSNLADVNTLDSFAIEIKNLAGQPYPTSGNFKLVELIKPQDYFKERLWGAPDLHSLDESAFKEKYPLYAYGEEAEPRKWKEGKIIANGTWKDLSKYAVELNKGKLSAGNLKLIIECMGEDGVKVEKEELFELLDFNKAENSGINFLSKNRNQQSWQPGDQVKINLNAHAPFYVYHELRRKNDVLNTDWKNAAKNVSITHNVSENDRGGLSAFYVFVKSNRVFKSLEFIPVPWDNKALQIETSTFREKLRPGDEEKWTVKIKGAMGDVVASELLANMYDASLDQFRANGYSLNLWPTNYSYDQSRAFGFGLGRGRGFAPQIPYPGRGNSRVYSNLNFFNFYVGRSGFFGRSTVSGVRRGEMKMKEMSTPMTMNSEAMEMDASVVVADDVNTELENVVVNVEEEQAEQSEAPKGDQVRTNLNETVFFFPDLKTDADGNVAFEFTMNEALTKWKYMLFAHSKDLSVATLTKEVVTQKELMVVPNAPRFFREGDKIGFSGKVVNISDQALTGKVSLEFADATTGEQVSLFVSDNGSQNFTLTAGQSKSFVWNLDIPFEKYQAITHTMRAQAGAFSDGERSDLPVLTNRMMVTEAMPLPVKSKETKTFDFARVNEIKASPTASISQFSLEYTSNPAWYAILALPYLMEYPYECSEQVFSRLYANLLASSIANANPRIKSVFEQWKNTDALLSNLSKNQELKTALLEETPWVMEAQSEEEQRKNIGILFDLMRMESETATAIDKLVAKQNSNGGFPWFAGGKSNRYITQHILTGFGHLNKLKVLDKSMKPSLNRMLEKSIAYVDEKFESDYLEWKRRIERNGGKIDKDADHLSPGIIQYFYLRTFFPETDVPQGEAHKFYYPQLEKYWAKKGMISQAQIALIHFRNGTSEIQSTIMQSLRERALHHDELGMYWKYTSGYFWHQQPIETHAFMIECFNEIDPKVTELDDLKTWLLKNKQTNRWETTKSTSLAVYALLVTGDTADKMLSSSELVNIKLGSLSLSPKDAEAGTGYFKQSWTAGEAPSDYQKITVSNPNEQIAWGAAYLQYFEDLDKITHYKETPLTIDRKLYKEITNEEGPQLVEIKSEALRPGDRVKVRIEIRTDRDMEFVHLKDGRGAGFEPENVLSGYRWQGRLGYYESTRDASTNFFIDFLPKGTHVFEYPLRAVHSGDFSAGVTTLQCMYAPEYTSHSEGVRVEVE